jgi:phage gpG-like protein
MNNEAHKLAEVRINFQRGLPRAAEDISYVAEQFFRRSFALHGSLNGGLHPWKQRAFEFPGPKRAILIKRGRLRDSVRRSVVGNVAHIKSNEPYSEIHNEGGQIPITPKMRRFFWAMYYQATKGMTRTKKGSLSKSAANLKLSQTAQIWRNLALTKKTHFTMPPRPFMYHSIELMGKIDRYITKFIRTL